MVGNPAKLPPRCASVGTVYVYDCPWRSLNPSYPKKKNVLSLWTGPPTLPPYWFCVKAGRATPALLLKKVLPLRTLLRRNSYSEPWKALVPDFEIGRAHV